MALPSEPSSPPRAAGRGRVAAAILEAINRPAELADTLGYYLTALGERVRGNQEVEAAARKLAEDFTLVRVATKPKPAQMIANLLVWHFWLYALQKLHWRLWRTGGWRVSKSVVCRKRTVRMSDHDATPKGHQRKLAPEPGSGASAIYLRRCTYPVHRQDLNEMLVISPNP